MEAHFQRALAIDPTDLEVLCNAASFLQSLGRLEALALDEVVVRRDPVNVAPLYNFAGDQRNAGRYDAAIASFRTVVSLSPNRSNAHSELGNALMLNVEAAVSAARVCTIAGETPATTAEIRRLASAERMR